ncbi:hypothetical protein F0L74_09790 [Chitinophaga agrisoli]|uniref:Uncharacterized protein n=1 Tax=Chitinophaga agrisoli TaxID=2607653 RepID=A0A5B2VVU2_9BACT|nr:hypothetical protein [Chitinophaga agrisoli]KAA2242810.1 hypothetical protein F0L74_09790 [Chitinophaga agrisoli]
MIKTLDLRPHSLVKDKRTAQVLTLQQARLNIAYENRSPIPPVDGEWTDVDPAPITEEWLKRLGFSPDVMPTSVDDSGSLSDGDDYWISANEKLVIRFQEGKAHLWWRWSATALHELQRLHLNVTGEELELKDLNHGK